MEKERLTEKPKIYTTPLNYSGSGKILGFLRIRNCIEAGIVFFVLYNVILFIPFTEVMKVAMNTVLNVPMTIWFLVGMNDESITQYLYGWFLYKQQCKNYVLNITGSDDEIRKMSGRSKQKRTSELRGTVIMQHKRHGKNQRRKDKVKK